MIIINVLFSKSVTIYFQVWASLSGWAIYSGTSDTVLQVNLSVGKLQIFTCKNKSEPFIKLHEMHLVPWTFLLLHSRFLSSTCAGSAAPPSCVCISCPSLSFVWVTSCGSHWLRTLWQPWPPFSLNPTCLLWTAASQLFCKLSRLVRRSTAMLFIMIWN